MNRRQIKVSNQILRIAGNDRLIFTGRLIIGACGKIQTAHNGAQLNIGRVPGQRFFPQRQSLFRVVVFHVKRDKFRDQIG